MSINRSLDLMVIVWPARSYQIFWHGPAHHLHDRYPVSARPFRTENTLSFDDVASTTGRPFRASLRIQEPRNPLTQPERAELIQAARKVLKLVIGAGFTRDEVQGMTFTVRPRHEA
jgi:hypothetical protein